MQEHHHHELALPPFNATDYFREMIYTTDFLQEDEEPQLH